MKRQDAKQQTCSWHRETKRCSAPADCRRLNLVFVRKQEGTRAKKKERMCPKEQVIVLFLSRDLDCGVWHIRTHIVSGRNREPKLRRPIPS